MSTTWNNKTNLHWTCDSFSVAKYTTEDDNFKLFLVYSHYQITGLSNTTQKKAIIIEAMAMTSFKKRIGFHVNDQTKSALRFLFHGV